MNTRSFIKSFVLTTGGIAVAPAILIPKAADHFRWHVAATDTMWVRLPMFGTFSGVRVWDAWGNVVNKQLYRIERINPDRKMLIELTDVLADVQKDLLSKRDPFAEYS